MMNSSTVPITQEMLHPGESPCAYPRDPSGQYPPQGMYPPRYSTDPNVSAPGTPYQRTASPTGAPIFGPSSGISYSPDGRPLPNIVADYGRGQGSMGEIQQGYLDVARRNLWLHQVSTVMVWIFMVIYVIFILVMLGLRA